MRALDQKVFNLLQVAGVESEDEIISVMEDNGYDYDGEERVFVKKRSRDKKYPDGILSWKIVFNSDVQRISVYYRDDEDFIVTDVTSSKLNKEGNDASEPFHSYSDFKGVQDWFLDHGRKDLWLAGIVMVGTQRRINDVLQNMTWGTFYGNNGKMRSHIRLEEQKTGKKVNPPVNSYIRHYMDEYVEENHINVKAHIDDQIFGMTPATFRNWLGKAKEAVGIDYPLGGHSYRKYGANLMFQLHRNDPNAMKIIQSILGHSDENITRIYIGQMDEEEDRYLNDLGDALLKKDNGEDFSINDSPMTIMTREDFRGYLMEAITRAQSGEDAMSIFNDLIGREEKANR